MPDTLYLEGKDIGRHVVTLKQLNGKNKVVASDTINISVEKIVYPFKDGQLPDWQNKPTTSWEGVAVANGWGITNALIDFIVAPTVLGKFETRRPDQPDKQATSEVNEDSYVYLPPLNEVPPNGFQLTFTFEFPKNYGPDATGYVQALDRGLKASFVGNSGVKFGTVVMLDVKTNKLVNKDVEVAVLDVPAMREFARLHEQRYEKGMAQDGRPEWKLGIIDRVSDEDPKDVLEGVTTLLNGVRYGGDIANLGSALITEENVSTLVASDTTPKNAAPILNAIFGTSASQLVRDADDPSKNGGQITIDVTRQANDTYTLTVNVGAVITYREEGIAMTMSLPRFQSHWGSGVSFENVSYATH